MCYKQVQMMYIHCQKGQSDLLVPVIPQCIKNVDLETEVVTIHLLPGLREMNQNKLKMKIEEE